jgi:glycosyltransferase involved in cell wall biosynthesis
MNNYQGRLGIIQRVLPNYRVPFFDLLAEHAEGGLSVFAGKARPSESIKSAEALNSAMRAKARNIHILGGPLYLCWQMGLVNWLDSWNPDALIVEANPRYISSKQAIHWMQARQRPIVAWGLGAAQISGAIARLRRARRLAFLNSFNAIIAYSQRGAEQYASLGIPQKKIIVAPNAVAGAPKSSPPKRPDEFPVPATILFVGRLQARKGVDRLLRACARQPEKVSPRCVIVGDGPERPKLESLAQSVYPKAEFMGGRYGAELDGIFAEADLLVLPGTGGLAIQQAMAKGLPVIVAQGDGTQEDLVSPENGWLLSSDDVSELAQTIKEALSDPANLREKGRKSFSLVKERYNLQTMVDVFVEVLNQVNA